MRFIPGATKWANRMRSFEGIDTSKGKYKIIGTSGGTAMLIEL